MLYTWNKIVLLLLAIIQCSVGSRTFMAGRFVNQGLVPPPVEHSRLLTLLTVESKTFTQKLDHFDTNNTVTWQQRYCVNEAVYQPGGPVFVFIGGEGPMQPGWLTAGQMYKNGVTHGALLLQPEHRFYGESRPTPDVSVASLKYLSSDQGLADLDYFIHAMKEQYKIPDAKVIVFGGSYPGNLAAWFREVYPQSSVGAVASSAPILAEADFVQYIETVGNAQKYFNPACYDAVQEAFVKIQELVANKDDAKLNELFGICAPAKLNYDDPWEIQTFYDELISGWMSATQYNAVGNDSHVALYCNMMTDAALGDPLHRYAQWFKQNIGSCVNHDYESIIEAMKSDRWDSYFAAAGTKQWIWQTCSQFAYYQSTDSKNQPFGSGTMTVEYLEEIYCKRPFGITSKEIADSVKFTNRKYGGRTPNATNIFFFNGSIDPWHTLSVYKGDLNPTCPSRYIEGTSHCYDMQNDIPNDPPAMTQARKDMADYITKWLQES